MKQTKFGDGYKLICPSGNYILVTKDYEKVKFYIRECLADGKVIYADYYPLSTGVITLLELAPLLDMGDYPRPI